MSEAIDRIYGTSERFTELRDWIIKNKPEAIKFLYYGEDIEFRKVWLGDWNNGLEHPMTYFPERIDKFMFENCPFAYVRDKIKLQYGDSVDWIEYKENNIYENSNVQTKRGRPKKGYDVIFDLTSKRYSDFFCARMYEKDILNMRDKLEEIIMDINNNKIKLIEENNES